MSIQIHWYLSLSDAMTKMVSYRREFNVYRPYNSLQGMTPEDAEKECAKNPNFLLLNSPKIGSRSSHLAK
jgi:hypothetical protein